MKNWFVISFAILAICAILSAWLDIVDRELYTVLAAISGSTAVVLHKLEEIENALAKRQAPQGSCKQGWEPARAEVVPNQEVLVGHWHEGYVSELGSWGFPARRAEDCKWVKGSFGQQLPVSISKDCPHRDKRSTR